jgi:hypothetical protein
MSAQISRRGVGAFAILAVMVGTISIPPPGRRVLMTDDISSTKPS